MLIAQSNPKSPISEAFRVLRTNIEFSSVDNPIKSLVFTSALPGEGKTTVISNLAVTFALQEKRVLLVDGDLRKPKIHKIFKVENDRGLTSFLSVKDDFRLYLKKTNLKNLDIMPCGIIPPNPSELLSSNIMKQFIKQVTNEYDVILIDTPPIGTVTDAALLSTVVDGTILIASSGTVEIDSIVRAKELLDQVNANIIGVVINKIDKSNAGKYHYYYYNRYYDENDIQISRRKASKKRREKKI
ncbi:MAG: CpsD/CapB family tyrosine-protein kinase [Clostridia bacterium]|jgi:capsular exopolysaccharide synthesis family protein